uniref:dUTP diphosphatase n=1 Tax=Siphoviridae sp. ct5co22 TaxID=2826294 RepID=A0A8S5QU16_9CAUD|nr:MAG TPA: dUTPase [Siphoviridae sp. ct5co22]
MTTVEILEAYRCCLQDTACERCPLVADDNCAEKLKANYDALIREYKQKQKMEPPTLPVQLDPGAYLPERAHETDAGLDLRTPVDAYVRAGGSTVIDTGVHIQLPPGTVGMLKSKSGLNVKDGIVSEGVIDDGYTGTILVKLYNHGTEAKQFSRGDKITQLVVLPVLYVRVEQVEEIQGGDRGDGGFGSTGR